MSKFTPSAALAPKRITSGQYTLRIKSEPKFEISKKSGNRMLVFELELVSPALIIVDGVETNVAGTEFRSYCVTEQGKTFQYEALCKSAGLPTLDLQDFDDNTGLPVGISFTGLEVVAVCKSELVERKNENGEPMIHPRTGEKSVSYRPVIEKFN
jgi:hypothetical protein